MSFKEVKCTVLNFELASQADCEWKFLMPGFIEKDGPVVALEFHKSVI